MSVTASVSCLRQRNRCFLDYGEGKKEKRKDDEGQKLQCLHKAWLNLA